ncbi:MAG: hypothetical protein ACE5HD_08145 [Acidobacteriota bacterium]
MRPATKFACAAFLSAVPLVPRAQQAPAPTAVETPVNGMGISLPGDWLKKMEDPGALLSPEMHSPMPEAPIYVRVVLGEEAFSRADQVARLMQDLNGRDLIPVLALALPRDDGLGIQPGGLDFDLDAWLEQVDALLSRLDLRPLLVEVGNDPSRRVSAEVYSMILKRTAVLVKAVNPEAVVATGPLSEIADLHTLAEQKVGPYVDVVCLDAGLAVSEAIAEVRKIMPAAALWLDQVDQPGQAGFLGVAARAFSHSVSLVLAGAGHALPPLALQAWRRLLRPSTHIIPHDFLRVHVRDAAGAFWPEDQILEFETADPPRRYVALLANQSRGIITLLARGPRVGIAWLVDPVTGKETVGGSSTWVTSRGERLGEQSGRLSRVKLDPGPLPALVRLGRFGRSPVAREEDRVHTARRLTLEEILARHRKFQARQDRILDQLVADARIEYHFSVANLQQTFDVTTVNRYFNDGTSAIYEERRMYINGALWTGRKPPDLPFVLPERVSEVPLNLSLDQHYEYHLEGQEKVNGRAAYVVSFAPLAPAKGTYRGKAWIDAEVFSKLKMEAVELGQELPVISNEFSQVYGSVESGGRQWNLLTSVKGQMVFTALGRNVVLQREIHYERYDVNPPQFSQDLEEAYRSNHQILQASGAGFHRLEKVPGREGGMAVRETRPGVSRLVGGGFGIDNNGTPGLPFAGVNYFNFDYRGTGNQLDVIWAGPFVDAFWSDPSLGGTRTILALEARVNPLTSRDRRIDENDGIDDDIKTERLQVSHQNLVAILGYPLATFHKVEVQADVDVAAFRGDDETADDFTVPADSFITSLALRWVYNRAGWRLEWTASGSRRSGWRFWGRPDGSDFTPGDEGYVRSSLVLNKTFFLRRFDRLGFRLSLYDGNGLDRFSKFGFGDFGVSGISGFSRSGIRFDRGGVLNLNYSINLGQRARMDLAVSHARFRNREDFGPEVQWATGGEVAVNFSGPFSSFIRVRLGGGLDTSLEDPDGSFGIRTTFFRTFNHWFWQRQHSGAKKKPRSP